MCSTEKYRQPHARGFLFLFTPPSQGNFILPPRHRSGVCAGSSVCSNVASIVARSSRFVIESITEGQNEIERRYGAEKPLLHAKWPCYSSAGKYMCIRAGVQRDGALFIPVTFLSRFFPGCVNREEKEANHRQTTSR